MKEDAPKYVLLKMANQPSYLMGRIVEESRDEVILYFPMLLSVYSDDQGTQVITSKYLPFVEDDLVSIVKTSIHAIAAPKQKLIVYYNEFVSNWIRQNTSNDLENKFLGIADAGAGDVDDEFDDAPAEETDTVH